MNGKNEKKHCPVDNYILLNALLPQLIATKHNGAASSNFENLQKRKSGVTQSAKHVHSHNQPMPSLLHYFASPRHRTRGGFQYSKTLPSVCKKRKNPIKLFLIGEDYPVTIDVVINNPGAKLHAPLPMRH